MRMALNRRTRLPDRRTRWGRTRTLALRSGLIAVAAVAALSVGGMAGARNEDRQGASPARDALQAELDAMVAAGIPSDDDKVQMLEDEVAALEELETAVPVPETGLDADRDGGTRSVSPGAVDATEQWEDGPVECEPIPGFVTADDIVGAECFVEPQASGGARYVIVEAGGNERSITFGEGPLSEQPAEEREPAPGR